MWYLETTQETDSTPKGALFTLKEWNRMKEKAALSVNSALIKEISDIMGASKYIKHSKFKTCFIFGYRFKIGG